MLSTPSRPVDGVQVFFKTIFASPHKCPCWPSIMILQFVIIMNTNDRQITEQTEETATPTDVMRRWLNDCGIRYDYDTDDDIIVFKTDIPSTELTVICGGVPGDLAYLIVRFPVRVPEPARQAVGEFLHRLNYASKRKFWEMDFNDGEVRMRGSTDLFSSPLDEGLFESLLRLLLEMASKAFLYLNAVTTQSMKPDFAADQALCALSERKEE